MHTPSWVGSLPHDFGTKKAGTLKAYQWRILWTIYIPLALVSLWSSDSVSHDPEPDNVSMVDVLANVMHLATALTFVYKHTTNPIRAGAFRSHFAAHVSGLNALFPGFGIPSYHTSFHLYDFLIALGPARSWWCFPFERLIGKLQRMKHNHRFGEPSDFPDMDTLGPGTNVELGELERTIIRAWWSGWVFRLWLMRANAPGFIQQCSAIFQRAFGYKSSTSSTSADPSDSDPDSEVSEEPEKPEGFVVPSPTSLTELVGTRVMCSRRIQRSGVFFTVCTTHIGNSLILYRKKGSSRPQPAQIQHIFRHNETTKIAVRDQLPLPVGISDPFAVFPDFPAQTYSGEHSSLITLIDFDDVVSHYARWTLRPFFSFVLDLTQVSPHINIQSSVSKSV
jgi:hypothetical protein